MDGGWPARPPTRAVPSEATLARMLPVLSGIGITRVANQTGLDVLGIPVFSAVRPNSRSLAVHQGKGLTPMAARVSAIMEGAECFLAENARLSLVLARPGELPDAVDPDRLPRHPGPPPGDSRLLWTTGRDLASGRVRHVPYELVHADFTLPQPPLSYRFRATTNGLASGNTAEEAALHALYEVVERDAASLWRLRGAGCGRVDADSVDHPDCRGLLRRLHGAGVQATLWDLASGTGLPAYLCLLVPPDGGLAGIEPEIGSGCHADAGTALTRAITEAAQARVTRIAGARDDYLPESYGAAARQERREQAEGWLAAARRGPSVPFRAASGRVPAPTIQEHLDEALDGLRRRGCDEAVWVDLSQPGLPFSGGRIVVPGLAGPP